MRARSIKPGFFLNEELSECKMESRLLFIGLWCYSDRRGRFKWSPKKIKASIFPYDNVDIESCLNELVEQHLVLKYEVSGSHYGAIPNFEIHQRPHNNEVESTIPPFNDNNEITPNEQPNDEVLSTLVESTFDLGEKCFQPNYEALRSRTLDTRTLNPYISSSKKPDDGVDEFFQPKPTEQDLSAKKPRQPKSSSLSGALLISFESFWTVWPKKVARKAAEKAWMNINPQNGLVETIIKSVKDNMNTDQWKKDNGQYIPHPSTWLNQERWNDQVSVCVGQKEKKISDAAQREYDWLMGIK